MEIKNVEVGSLTEGITSDNSGIFWLGTTDETDDACFFTTSSVPDEKMSPMVKGYNDFFSNYLPKILGR